LSRGSFSRNHAGSHLLESELFGHESRAFTGAQRENRGRFGVFRREVPGQIKEPGRKAAGGAAGGSLALSLAEHCATARKRDQNGFCFSLTSSVLCRSLKRRGYGRPGRPRLQAFL
jgi:hypothetical protein